MATRKLKKPELIFIPSPGIGHLVSAVGMAKLLVDREKELSVTVLIMKVPLDTKDKSYKQSLSAESTSGIQFIELPEEKISPDVASAVNFLSMLIEIQKKHVRSAVEKIVMAGTARLAGIVIDMFCTPMIDVANEFGVPSYLFFTSGAAMLGLMFHLQTLRDDLNEEITEYKDSKAELRVQTYMNPFPAEVLPSIVMDRDGGSDFFLNLARRFRETKGIIINTFQEFESHALKSLSREENIPPVYSVGPILNTNPHKQEENMIFEWLDNQPTSSVVFLCFGSMGSFESDQVKEIAHALERCGQRFLWSLRRSPPKGQKLAFPSEFQNLEEILPEGFLQRTAGTGKVIGWAPQYAVLSHTAVGGFVSHSGWNSILESVWNGVPVAAWPLYAEQQANAFQMVTELGLAVEIKMDYRRDFWTMESPPLVAAEEIESGIRLLLESESEMKKKVGLMKENSRMAVVEGGSSYASVGCLIDEFTARNIR